MSKKHSNDSKIKKNRKKLTGPEKAAHDAAVTRAVVHFATTYIASDGSRLANLQQLCKDLEVEVGDNTLACKDNIKGAHVNIHDFIRVRTENGNVSAIKFPSNEALQENILSDPKRMFPLRLAESDELLEAMLIHVEGKHKQFLKA